MKAKSALLRMAVAILGFIALNACSASAGWSSQFLNTTKGLPTANGSTTRMRVVSANLTSGANQEYLSPGINILKGLKPDIVAIQEFNYGDKSDADARIMVDDAFGTNFYYYREPTRGIPNGVISRWPIVENGYWEDADEVIIDRNFVWSRIDIPGTNDLYLVSIHLKASDGITNRAQRAAESDQLKSLVLSNFPASSLIIIAGDLNLQSAGEYAYTNLLTFMSDSPSPVDNAGNHNTDAKRDSWYDHILFSSNMAPMLSGVEMPSHVFPNGLVFDSRVYTPLSDVDPVTIGDSAVSNMQHMAVVRDYQYVSSETPAAPTGVSVTDGTYSDRIQVSWTASSGATGYEVWRNTNNVSGSATRIGQKIARSPYNDTTVAQGITNYYWLKATNSSGTSAFSSSDWGLRAFSFSYRIAGAISYGGSQTGMVRIMALPHFDGQTNLALTLDGVDDGVVVQAPTDLLQLGTQMTMCAWINVTGQLAGTFATMLVKFETSTNKVAYLFGLNSKDGKPYATFGDGHNFSASLGVGVTSGWTHLAFTHDGTIGTWYINGQFSSVTNKGSIGRRGGGQFYIGRCNDLQEYLNRFPGQLDDIGLWSRTLTQGEIQGVMNNGLSGTETGLAGCWNFDDGTASDLTTNSNDGQFLSGATTTVHVASASRYSTNLASPGGYAISNVPAGEYNVWAYRDSSGNGSNDPWEVHGHYLANPLSVTGAMGGVDIALHDPMADEDLDGLSDYDEVYVYGTSWTNADTDADGMPDGDEVLAGSSPTNGESMFGFADSQPVPDGGGVVVSWPSLSNRVYRLERTTNLLLDFEPLVNDLPADPPVNSYTDDTPNVLGAYKVGVRME